MILSNRQLRVLLFPHVRSFVISQFRQPHVNGGVLVFLFVSRIVSRFQLCNCMFISASFMGVLFLNKSGNLSKICLFSDWWSSCNRMFPFVSLNFSIPIHRFLRQPLCFHSRLRSVFFCVCPCKVALLSGFVARLIEWPTFMRWVPVWCVIEYTESVVIEFVSRSCVEFVQPFYCFFSNFFLPVFHQCFRYCVSVFYSSHAYFV